VHRDKLRAGVLQHFGVLQTLIVVLENAHFRRNWHVAVGVRRVDQLVYQLHVLHQEGPVVPLLGNPLRTAQIQIHGVALPLDHRGGRSEHVRVVGAELDYERAVRRARGELLLAVAIVFNEEARVEHGSVG